MTRHIVAADREQARTRPADRDVIDRLAALAKADDRSERDRLRRGKKTPASKTIPVRTGSGMRIQHRLPEAAGTRVGCVRNGKGGGCRDAGSADENQQPSGQRMVESSDGFHDSLPSCLMREARGIPTDSFGNIHQRDFQTALWPANVLPGMPAITPGRSAPCTRKNQDGVTASTAVACPTSFSPD